MKLWIIIPAYNEAASLSRVVEELNEFIIQKGWAGELLVIDDGSHDNTADRASLAGAKVIKHKINLGQGAALKTGNSYSLNNNADIIVHFDADGQHRTADIDNLIQPIIRGNAEVVLGSRFLNSKFKVKNTKLWNYSFLKLPLACCQLLSTSSIPLGRRILLFGSLMTNYLITQLPLTDVHNGLRAISAAAAYKLDLRQPGMAHATEYLNEIKRLKLRYQEVPVTINYNVSHKKSQGFFEGLKIIKDLLWKNAIK